MKQPDLTAGSYSTMKVLGIGEIVLDKVNVINNHPQDGEKIQATQTHYSVGGPVPAALILLSKLGINCIMVGSIGNDSAGALVGQMLEEHNITVKAKLQRQTKTNTVLVNAQSASRTIIKDKVKGKQLTKIPTHIVEQADVIIFDRHEPQAFGDVVIHKRLDSKIIIDPSTEVTNKTLNMIRLADYPIVPIEVLDTISLHKLYEIARKNIIVTLGDKGSLLYDGTKVHYQPACEIKAIDTLGAGDVYRGAYSYGVLQQWQDSKIMRYANLVSALQCTRVGNGTAIPGKQEIDEFAKIVHYKKISLPQVNLKL